MKFFLQFKKNMIRWNFFLKKTSKSVILSITGFGLNAIPNFTGFNFGLTLTIRVVFGIIRKII